MKTNLTVTEVIKTEDKDYITNPILDGYFLDKFKENLLLEEDENTVNHMLANAFQSIPSFKNPKIQLADSKPSKVLCLGKVQSGKTSFFLAATALAFDNGYDVAYILGGTKLKLKKQNLERIMDSFKNNSKVKIFDVRRDFNEDLNKYISEGYKIILVILKNASKNTNLGKLKELSILYSELPAVIIDDEGDEVTPGADKQKNRNSRAGKTHEKIVEIINSFECCTLLSVTATPQANLLVSIFNGISPDRLVLVKPGDGYTGGHAFFDTNDNPHIQIINDKDDFVDSIPDSFKKALYFFIFSCALKRSKGDLKPLSMLVHPSSFNVIQNDIGSRIKDLIRNTIIPAVDVKSIAHEDLIYSLTDAYNTYSEYNSNEDIDLDEVFRVLPDVIKRLKSQVVNHGNAYDEYVEDGLIYQIKIGGNMLGRGLTIDRLIVSYIYRDSKEAQVDTMYQRCRWFGYKKSYFDVCRVYMPSELRDKFMAIVSNEDHMWNSMESFLETQINLRKFKRIFVLENDNLILTRKSISNTVPLKVISSGNRADENIDLTKEEKEHNRNVYMSYCKSNAKKGRLVDFDNSVNHNQRHLIIEENFVDFYENFLSKIKFGYGSIFSGGIFKILIDKIKNGEFSNEVLVMLMRYEKGEYRSPATSIETTISRLFQGRNEKTEFSGDRYPVDINGEEYRRKPFIQIHMVDTKNENPRLEDSIPLISYNNPITSQVIKMVTGDNIYEE